MKKLFFCLMLALPTLSFAQVSGGACIKSIRGFSHRQYDRVVFELQMNDAPTMATKEAEFVTGPLTDEQHDRPFRVRGTAFIKIVWSGVDMETCRPPARKALNLSNATEMVLFDNFEGYLGYYIGMKRKRDIKTTVLTNPARIVIDIKK